MLNIFETVVLNTVRSFVRFLFVHIQIVNNQLMLVEVTNFFFVDLRLDVDSTASATRGCSLVSL